MATNIPAHNLTELINAIKILINSDSMSEITVEDLMEHVK